MEMSTVLTPVLFLGIAGAFFGVILSIASKVFYVEVDPKVAEVRDVQMVHDHIKSLMGSKTKVLYGGSVKPENANLLILNPKSSRVVGQLDYSKWYNRADVHLDQVLTA